MAGVEEHNKKSVALVLLLAGGALVLAGAGVIIYQQHLVATRGLPPAKPVIDDPVPMAAVIQKVLFSLLILVLVFCVTMLAFVRFSRRFRQWLLRRPAPPTPAEDVWAMHQLPPDLDPAGYGENTEGPAPPPDEQGPESR